MYKWGFIQLASLVLTVIGLVVIPICLCLNSWPKLAWIWFNDDDGYGPSSNKLNEFVWLALRNPVANLRHVKWVAQIGGPLYYKTWFWMGKQFYYKFGYLPNNGWPCLSAGSGRGW